MPRATESAISGDSVARHAMLWAWGEHRRWGSLITFGALRRACRTAGA